MTLYVATARGAVHGSREVVFRRWNGWTLAEYLGPPVFSEAHERTGFRTTRLLVALRLNSAPFSVDGRCSLLSRVDVHLPCFAAALERIGCVRYSGCTLRLQFPADLADNIRERPKLSCIYPPVGIGSAIPAPLADADEWVGRTNCGWVRSSQADD